MLLKYAIKNKIVELIDNINPETTLQVYEHIKGLYELVDELQHMIDVEVEDV